MSDVNLMAEKVVIGNSTLYQGDAGVILPTLPKVDLILTDPPYGVSYAANPLPVMSKQGRRVNHAPQEWDNSLAPNWLIGLIREKSREQIIWGGNYYDLPPTRGWLIWRKPDAPPSMAHFEMAWTSYDMNARQIDHPIAATNAERMGHPTQKPIRVMEWSLSLVKEPCDMVCDPFMGSGTTGIACVNLNKTFIGIERDPKHFALACSRIKAAHSQQRLFA